MNTAKYITSMIVILLFTTSAMAGEVDFHGLKTGMTKTEVIQYLHLDKIMEHSKKEHPFLFGDKTDKEWINEQFSTGIFQKDLEKISKLKAFSNKAFSGVSLYFTRDDLLWKVLVTFPVPGDDPLAKVGLKKAIQNYFKGYEVTEDSIQVFGNKLNYYRVTMVDNTIYESAIKKFVNTYLKVM